VRHLRDDTVLILDGEVRVYRRERSRRWQAAFSIDGKPIRISTGKKDLNEAKEIARDTYLEYKFRHKNDLPVITKKFSDVARLAIADMRKQLDAGLGKKVYADYIVCIERYLICLTLVPTGQILGFEQRRIFGSSQLLRSEDEQEIRNIKGCR